MSTPAQPTTVGVVCDDAIDAFATAIAEIRSNGNRVSDGLLDAMLSSFTKVANLARTLDKFLTPEGFAAALEANGTDVPAAPLRLVSRDGS